MGEIASLLTSVCWVFSMMSFSAGGERVGSRVVNRVRLVFGLILLGTLNLILYSEFIPFTAGLDRWGWLGLSGLVGLVIGDAFLFQALLWVGPRRALLIMAASPVLNTLIAWIFLGESLSLLALVGITVTMAGIFTVISEKTGTKDSYVKDKKHFSLGLVFAVLAVVGQSSGMIFAKLGVYGDFPALTGTLMRVVVSSIAMWVLALFSGQVKPSINALKNDHKALGFIALGALTGPFLGIWFSLIGLQNTDVGIASTLQSLSPVLVLPVSMFIYKEKVSARALIGTVVAMVGVAFIFILA